MPATTVQTPDQGQKQNIGHAVLGKEIKGDNMKITKTYLKQLIKEELDNLAEIEQIEEFKPGSPKFKEILDNQINWPITTSKVFVDLEHKK